MEHTHARARAGVGVVKCSFIYCIEHIQSRRFGKNRSVSMKSLENDVAVQYVAFTAPLRVELERGREIEKLTQTSSLTEMTTLCGALVVFYIFHLKSSHHLINHF